MDGMDRCCCELWCGSYRYDAETDDGDDDGNDNDGDDNDGDDDDGDEDVLSLPLPSLSFRSTFAAAASLYLHHHHVHCVHCHHHDVHHDDHDQVIMVKICDKHFKQLPVNLCMIMILKKKILTGSPPSSKYKNVNIG